jgi:hypothetical protein
MRILSTTEINKLKETQESTLFDTCTINSAVVSGEDSYGQEVINYVHSDVSCGFNFNGGIENSKGQIVELDYDALVRFPKVTVINPSDTITFEAEEYEVVGLASNKFCKTVRVRRVQI